MAINSSLPKETIQVEGKEKITSQYEVNTFSPTRKLESTVEIIDTDGYVNVFTQNITPVRRIYINAPIFNSTIELPYVTKIKISRLETIGATGIIENELCVEGLNILKFPEAFGELITNVQVSTTCSESSKIVKVSVYAWSDEI